MRAGGSDHRAGVSEACRARRPGERDAGATAASAERHQPQAQQTGGRDGRLSGVAMYTVTSPDRHGTEGQQDPHRSAAAVPLGT